MTEKLSIRSVIYKLLAARKKCYRFFAKKRKAWSIIQKKKIILCLKFYCSSLFTNDSAILCFFFPPNLPILLTALVWPVLGQKKCVSFATMIPIYYYDQNTRNIQSELVVLFTLFNTSIVNSFDIIGQNYVVWRHLDARIYLTNKITQVYVNDRDYIGIF